MDENNFIRKNSNKATEEDGNKAIRANWTNSNLKVFLDLCNNQVMVGGRPCSNLSRQSWPIVIKEFEKKTGLSYNQRILKNKWDQLKKQWNAWSKLTSLTRIGRDPIDQRVIIENDSWDEYLKANPDAMKFRYEPLMFANEMELLFGGTSATGKAAWVPDGSIPYDMRLEETIVDLDSNEVDVEFSNRIGATDVNSSIQNISADKSIKKMIMMML
ncbi:hypothetical protein Sjap_005229 [Stephania japonica]|uniref:Myb/SANT-like domain-containing protein n=1 Tax=Stephania japonica TaxID=461633 RepID=A0AAP0K3V6_9MAGN